MYTLTGIEGFVPKNALDLQHMLNLLISRLRAATKFLVRHEEAHGYMQSKREEWVKRMSEEMVIYV
jgi:hypothetical protein